jgi:hypothetical protein
MNFDFGDLIDLVDRHMPELLDGMNPDTQTTLLIANTIAQIVTNEQGPYTAKDIWFKCIDWKLKQPLTIPELTYDIENESEDNCPF